jgi:hypothetical protein
VNASLNGEPLIAWQSPLPRRDGALQIITFDALAVLHEVTIKTLDPAITLRQPNATQSISAPASQPLKPEIALAAVAEAKLELNVRQMDLALAQAELESVERRADAQRAEWKPNDETRLEKTITAVRAERFVNVVKARHHISVAELALQRTAADKKEAAEKTLNAAREVLEKATKAMETEIKSNDTYAKFRGANWTPTRFMNSGKDDPEVKFHPQSTGRRTALANWITDRRNPLTARVAVNHIWTRHMGQPLVPTVFDLGRKGTPPTHPELLDWLASELIDSEWSMRHIHSLIVNSAAYRMSSSITGADVSAKQDPANHYWWRRLPIRMESQVIRDSLLSLSGTLDSTRGGPSIPSNQQETSRRRSLYFYHSNNERHLFLTMFDEALVKDCYRREQSIVPQQALALSNSRLTLDNAEKIALQLTEKSLDDETFIRSAFRLITGINPNRQERSASIAALENWNKLPGGNEKSARVNFIWVLINHNDFVTLR